MEFKDETIVCRFCDSAFVWDAGQQSFYHDRGLARPVRCPECRAKKRAVRILDHENAKEQR